MNLKRDFEWEKLRAGGFLSECNQVFKAGVIESRCTVHNPSGRLSFQKPSLRSLRGCRRRDKKPQIPLTITKELFIFIKLPEDQCRGFAML